MLTKEAKTVLYHMYKEYLVRRDNHIPRSQSKEFGSAENVQSLLFPDWELEDIVDTLRELGRNGFVKNFNADNTVYTCSLTDSAIVKMENQKKETLLSIADFIAKFIP
ncbi:hypothetical protein FND36_10335 [Lachnospiraceae bacterium KGMB03038]|nr:hypothetical protein FND36_10335 [Lachnospiraceae bacterium KGMB03038]